MSDPAFLVVGHLSKAHGTKGEIYVWPLTDYPDSHFAQGAVHHIGEDDARVPVEGLPPLVVETVRPYRRGFLVRFENVPDRTAAERLRGRYLLRPFDTIDDLAEGEMFYHELLGSSVVTTEGRPVGDVVEVLPVKSADLLQVEGDAGELLVPVTREIVVDFDREHRRVVVDLPDGLLQPEAGDAGGAGAGAREAPE